MIHTTRLYNMTRLLSCTIIYIFCMRYLQTTLWPIVSQLPKKKTFEVGKKSPLMNVHRVSIWPNAETVSRMRRLHYSLSYKMHPEIPLHIQQKHGLCLQFNVREKIRVFGWHLCGENKHSLTFQGISTLPLILCFYFIFISFVVSDGFHSKFLVVQHIFFILMALNLYTFYYSKMNLKLLCSKSF